MTGNRAYYANIKLLKFQLLSKDTKMKLYKTLIRPVVTYGAETWCLTQEDSRKLRVFERKIVRRIYGAIQVNGQWRLRNNAEIEGLIQNENIINFIKVCRLRWAGHVVRMGGERLPKRLLEANFTGKRRKGRPKSRWWDEVVKDARKLGVQNINNEAHNRIRWRKLILEAKGLPDL